MSVQLKVCAINSVWLCVLTNTILQVAIIQDGSYYIINVKKLKSLKQCLTATRPTSHNKNSKNQKGGIT